jgi:hypothetical protein
MLGSCRESPVAMNTATAIAIVALLAGGGVAGYAFMLGKGLPEASRKTWYALKLPQKKELEKKYACCGFTTVEEGTPTCKPDHPCEKKVVAELAGRLKITVILAAVVVGMQVGVIFCTCCMGQKIQSQQSRKAAKDIEKGDKKMRKREKKAAKREVKSEKERQKGYKEAELASLKASASASKGKNKSKT